jgi:translation elongation factor EF-1alpha
MQPLPFIDLLIGCYSVRSFHALCNMPLRVVVDESYKIGGVGTCVQACIRSGVLRKGQDLVVANTNVTPQPPSFLSLRYSTF